MSRGMSGMRLSHPSRFLDSAPRDTDSSRYLVSFSTLTRYQRDGTLACLGCGNGAPLAVPHSPPAALIRDTDLRRRGSVESPVAFASGEASRKKAQRRRHPLC